ncbi:MAG: DUF2080 family transposase-associated protein [Deltaproteobacteria bacterium]|nr:DUF2080 family transposase-associated protein [Deltaproteobacteria bacterium]
MSGESHSKPGLARLEILGREMIEKQVKTSGNSCNSGRIYLPSAWLGCRVKIVRLD